MPYNYRSSHSRHQPNEDSHDQKAYPTDAVLLKGEKFPKFPPK